MTMLRAGRAKLMLRILVAAEADAWLRRRHVVEQALPVLVEAHLALGLEALPAIADTELTRTAGAINIGLVVGHARYGLEP